MNLSLFKPLQQVKEKYAFVTGSTSRCIISQDFGATIISRHFLVYNEKNMYGAVKSMFSHLEIGLTIPTGYTWQVNFFSPFVFI